MLKILLSLMVIGLVSCGQADNKAKTEESAVLAFSENTTSDCSSDNSSTQTTAADGKATLISTVYTDSECKDKIVVIEMQGTYSAADGSDMAHQSVDHPDLDSVVTSLTATILTKEGINEANAAGYYGYKNWKINVPKDILGKSQDGATESIRNAGDKFFE